MSLLRGGQCEKCNADYKKGHFFSFIFTYRYTCPKCSAKYSISTISVISLTFLGLIIATIGIFVFDLEKYVAFPLAVVVIGTIAGLFVPLTRVK